jgi:hypothetical protein
MSVKKTILICQGTGCVSSGSPQIQREFEREIAGNQLDVAVKLTDRPNRNSRARWYSVLSTKGR